MEQSGRRSIRRLAASPQSVQLQKYFFNMAREAAAKGEPIVWASPTHALEIFWAMDIIPQMIINYSAVIGAKQRSAEYLALTESRGYYRDLCRYCSRNIMGYLMSSDTEKAPWGGMAKPSCVVAMVACDPLPVVWDFIAEAHKVPIFYMDRSWAPRVEDMEMFPVDADGVWNQERPRKPDRRMKWAVEQVKEMVFFLETHTGKKLQESKLRHVAELSRQGFWYATQVDLMRRKIPCPISATDWWVNIPPWLHYRGREESLVLVKGFYEEVKARADAGIGVVEKEKYRLLWIGYPIWFSIGFLNLLEEKLGAVVVWEYPHIPQWTAHWHVDNALEEATRLWLDYGSEAAQAVQSFGQVFLPAAHIKGNVDAAIITRMESCKPLSSGIRYYERDLDRLGIPYIELNMDPVDNRDWNEEKAMAQISNLLETIKPRC